MIIDHHFPIVFLVEEEQIISVLVFIALAILTFWSYFFWVLAPPSTLVVAHLLLLLWSLLDLREPVGYYRWGRLVSNNQEPL